MKWINKKMPEFKSTHNLPFLCRPYEFKIDDGNIYDEFKIGTCVGLWTCSETSYDILSIINKIPGNGHIQDVLDWFENSCKRENFDLRFMEIMNEKFAEKCIKNHGFTREKGTNNLIKFLRKKWKCPRKAPAPPNHSFIANLSSFR
jgi:hypothetical protein